MTRPGHRAPIVCVEGPSAVGKTTLAATLARTAGAVVIPELDATGAPPIPESAAWFAARHAAHWRRAVDAAAVAPLVVLDGDPFKGFWYNPVYASAGWPGVDEVAPLHRALVADGALAFPDLYVVLLTTETELRARRAGDPTRTRRHFETHLQLVAPQRRWFVALRAAAPRRVVLVDTADRDRLPDVVRAAIAERPPGAPDSVRLLDAMVAWAARSAPAWHAPRSTDR